MFTALLFPTTAELRGFLLRLPGGHREVERRVVHHVSGGGRRRGLVTVLSLTSEAARGRANDVAARAAMVVVGDADVGVARAAGLCIQCDVVVVCRRP